MTVATIEKGKWATLGRELKKSILENNLKPKSQRNSLKEIFENFSSKHDTTFSSAQQYYYTEIRPNMNTPKNFDESIEEFSKSKNPDPTFRSVRDIHKIGDTVQVEATSIKDFGIFCKTEDGYEGLLHISQITGKQYVTLPEDFFYVGEKFDAKIIRYEGEKLSFSTKLLGGKERLNPAFKDLASKKVEKEQKVAIKEKKVEPKIEKKVEVKPPSNPTSATNNDKDNIINFIKKYSDNNVSQKALGDIDDLIEKYGVFQTTMVLMSTVRDLDISSFITEMTKERLEGEYLRQP